MTIISKYYIIKALGNITYKHCNAFIIIIKIYFTTNMPLFIFVIQVVTEYECIQRDTKLKPYHIYTSIRDGT